MNDFGDSSELCSQLPLERTEHEDHDVEMARFQGLVNLDSAYTNENVVCTDSRSNSNDICDRCAMFGECMPPSEDKDTVSSSWPRLDHATQSPTREPLSSPSSTQSVALIKCDKHDYQANSNVARELTFFSSSYDGSTTICSSSPVSKERLCHEEENQINMLSEMVSGDAHWTPPPSSSPLQCSSLVEIMSSPVGQGMTKEEERDENEFTCLKRSVESLCPDEHVTNLEEKQDMTHSGKRKRSESLSALDQFEEPRISPTHGNRVPHPKRLTARSQRLQHEKLKTPFRSPLLIKPERNEAEPQLLKPIDDVRTLKVDQVEESASPKPNVGITVQENNGLKDTRTKYRTARAATPFKSPLSIDSTTKHGKIVQMTPNIQTLERKSQVLKRALKIKREDQEHILGELARKWIDAGREVAWELWSLVNDNGTSEYEASNQVKRLWPSNGQCWGWNEPINEEQSHDESPCMSGHETDDAGRNISYNRAPAMEDEPLQNTLGIMLRRLGVDPETFGWDEGEGTFMDN